MKQCIIENVTIFIDDVPVVNNVTFSLPSGSLTILMGQNGSGKSSLAYALMGHPRYRITSGDITLDGNSLNNMSVDKRAHAGLFLAVQHPYEIPGVSVFSFLIHAYQACKGNITTSEMKEKLSNALEMVGLDQSFMDRSLNDGFSGGEKKRLELAQMLVLEPRFVILDEIDSGLDIDALSHVHDAINRLKKKNPDIIFLIITHSPTLARMLTADYVHVMSAGSIVATADSALLDEIEKHGYKKIS